VFAGYAAKLSKIHSSLKDYEHEKIFTQRKRLFSPLQWHDHMQIQNSVNK
jgi:hypothetical protein